MAKLVNAEGSQVKEPISEIVTSTYVENKDPLEFNNDNAERVIQQNIVPSAVQSRLLTNQLITNNPESSELGSGISAGPTVVKNATSSSFLFYIESNDGSELFVIPDIAFYIGNSITAPNQWPNPTYGMGNMPVSVFNDWGLTDNFKVVTRAIIRNNTGADQTVICIGRFRIITSAPVAGAPASGPITIYSNSGVQQGQGGGGGS